MIVLDTNVLSEGLRPQPFATVLQWMDSEPITALFTITITEAELLYGAASRLHRQPALLCLRSPERSSGLDPDGREVGHPLNSAESFLFVPCWLETCQSMAAEPNCEHT